MIDYARWLAYCCAVTASGDPGPGFEADEDRMRALDPPAVAAYLQRMLDAIPAVAGALSDEQLGNLLWFAFGVSSDYCMTICSDSVSTDARAGCVAGLARAFPAVFDRRCCAGGTDPDGRYSDKAGLDMAVYMLWDISEFADHLPRFDPGVLPAVCDALRVSLQCRTSTCIIAGLHGVGHLQRHAPALARALVDEALATATWPQWVTDYALRSRAGQVM